jgi:hypothetical protein
MELESSTQNVVLSLSTSHMDEEKIYFLEASYRFIRIPVNQKYSTTRMSKNVQQQSSWIQSIATVTVKIHGVRKYKRQIFTDLVTFDVESGLQELPEHLLHQTNIKTFNEWRDFR